MKLDLLAVVLVIGGATLVYCAVRNQDPRDVIRVALGNKIDIRPIAPEMVGVIRSIVPPSGGGGGTPRFTELPLGTQQTSV